MPKRPDGKALQWWVEALKDPVWWQGWTANAAPTPILKTTDHALRNMHQQ